MLDNETKRKIDSARSILVGKVPDPKAQVEQITTALIYKFMDDMDRESEELGGVAKFVIGELKEFQWAKLMSKELGGEARLILYTQALTAFSKADGIPDIFRTIFKDAFLPYRDPETLNLFLKEIDYFDYDHSENLGDAFEYLLSVLGSQGDAGQFRTPRHIIDFIVEVLEPKKSDTILDPSCGTAGFLISAYKHISANEQLSHDDKKQLMHNFTGYDISPDMVRLSLVNMYLHSFPQPKIYEYDTLTSEDRWNDSFDVILANPPFMTPKGGIRPHSRFSVQANRSEVLFIDYIAEHLNLNGRAGIIVPEGIIFQSANAYKALRKMLVENGFLWAVVSLPAGVFQPYSGVKTSILLLDRTIAKQNDSILFVKISNDGFGLGAQRREIAHNDLIPALEVIKSHRKGETVESPIAQRVLKTKIAESGDYNLTGERYKETKAHENLVYPLVKLGDENYFKIESGGTPDSNNSDFWDGEIKWVTLADLPQDNFITEIANSKRTITLNGLQKSSAKLLPPNSILVSSRATIGRIAISKIELATNQGFKNIIIKDFSKTNEKYIALVLTNLVEEMELLASGGTFKEISKSSFSTLQIPLPPLEIQNAIVAEIEQWQKVIDGAKQVVANYRPTISIQPDWEMVKLGDVCETITDGDHQPPPKSSAGIPFVTITNINNQQLDFSKTFFVSETYYENLKEFRKPKLGDILYTVTGSFGIPVFVEINDKFCFQRHIALIRTKPQLLNKFLYCLLSSPFMTRQAIEAATGVAQKTISLNSIRNFIIPLPPLETQNAIVEQIEKERAAVESCNTLIAMFEDKIKRKIGEVWGDDDN